MSVEEVQQLVTNDYYVNDTTQDDELVITTLGDDENFDCLIAGKTSYTEFFKPGWDIYPFSRLIFIKPLVNGIISFGRYVREYGGGSEDQ